MAECWCLASPGVKRLLQAILYRQLATGMLGQSAADEALAAAESGVEQPLRLGPLALMGPPPHVAAASAATTC